MQPRSPVRSVRCASSLLAIATALFTTNTSAGAPCRGLQGTFLQLTETQAARPADDWRQLVSDLRSIGINDLFLQWTVVDRKAFFQTAGFDTPANTPLPDILDLSAHAGIRVWIGLAMDTRYWEEIKQGPDLLRTYFYKRVQELRGFIDELNSAISRAPFAGWYITDEIDDRTWLDSSKRTLLKKYLADTVSLLKARRPGSRVAISGFSNSFADPDLLASFWVDLLESSGIDLLLFQDGVGEGKVTIEDIPLYYEPLNRAVRLAGGQLGAVVELFSLMPNGQRVPAMIGRINEQIAAAYRLTSFPPVAFSVPDYMSNLAGQQASGLLANFLAAQKRCRG
jgi:Domain of unknown function (DUF4434)